MLHTPRRFGTALAATALLTAGLAVCAATASAKSELTITTGARSVAVGGTVNVRAQGASDDFGGATMRLCIEQRTAAHGWRSLGCTTGYRLAVKVRPAHRGSVSFRAQLVAVLGGHHERRAVDCTSATVVVRVR